MPAEKTTALKPMIVLFVSAILALVAATFWGSSPSAAEQRLETDIRQVQSDILAQVQRAGPDGAVAAFCRAIDQMVIDDGEALDHKKFCGEEGHELMTAHENGVIRAFAELPARERNLVLKHVEDEMEKSERQWEQLGRPSPSGIPVSREKFLQVFAERHGPLQCGDPQKALDRVQEALAYAVDETERLRCERMVRFSISAGFREVVAAEDANAAHP